VEVEAWNREVRNFGKTVAKGWILGISDNQYSTYGTSIVSSAFSGAAGIGEVRGIR
jgi:hypothetical protein